ncbi:agmatinase [Roseinatronobacter sp.]|uniref:agmatinase n=1 Tax=Roseinatronobacter sp. TaxID=1945755 RepID=UPI0025F66596|nr:agmatinase [Rhodobaca sp.]
MAFEKPGAEVDDAFLRPDLKGLSFESTFGGATSFLRRKYTRDLTGVDLAVTGVPFDQAASHRAGTRMGPRAIREASCLQPCYPPYGWGFDPLTEFSIIDYGDLAFDFARIQDFPETLRAHIAGILKAGIGTLTLGGDHYITLPILRAYAAKFGPMSVIQFDAHSDLWPDDDPARIDHGTMMYKAVREGLVNAATSVQVGIRTECADYLGMTVIDAFEAHEIGPKAVAAKLREIVGPTPCYVSFDIDALDPAFAPGTGTPVWNGLTPNQVAVILRQISGINMKGGDVVEVSPAHDPSGVTAVMGAHVGMELICLYCQSLQETGRK